MKPNPAAAGPTDLNPTCLKSKLFFQAIINRFTPPDPVSQGLTSALIQQQCVTERILLVDDEEALVNIGKLMLERLGYTVTSTTSSAEALAAFRAAPHKFDPVITD
jgi:PleD family two-component response regulator